MLRSGEIRLWDEDVETLRKAKDAYEGDYSCASEQILIEASRWLLEAFLEEYRSQTKTSSYTIPLNVLKDWMTESQPQSGATKEVLKPKGKKLYLQNKSKFQGFENEKKREYITQNKINTTRIEDINDNSIHLTLADINYLLDLSILKVIGISGDSLRFCTEQKYGLGKKGQRTSKQSYIVQAYCEVLGLDFESLQCCQLHHQNPKDQRTNNEKIYRVLTKFNYTNLVNFTRSIAAKPLREGSIYIPPCPHTYRFWCLRRLEKEILITNNLPVKPIVFKFQGDGQEEWDSYSLHEHFFNNSGGIKNLKTNNFCLIFEGIDCADFSRLKDIDSFWQNLKKASQIQNSPIPGFLLMIWLDYGEGNDWRDSDRLSEFPIHRLQIDSCFEQRSFQEIIPTFAQQLQLGCDLQDETTDLFKSTLQELWENSKHGNIEDTLKAFYQQFQGQLSRENRWINYP